MLEKNKSYFYNAKKISVKIFNFKKTIHKKWAHIPIKDKIRELIALQEIMVHTNKKYKKLHIIPWRITD